MPQWIDLTWNQYNLPTSDGLVSGVCSFFLPVVYYKFNRHPVKQRVGRVVPLQIKRAATPGCPYDEY
jgi:hypothetical protein